MNKLLFNTKVFIFIKISVFNKRFIQINKFDFVLLRISGVAQHAYYRELIGRLYSIIGFRLKYFP